MKAYSKDGTWAHKEGNAGKAGVEKLNSNFPSDGVYVE